MIRGPNRQQSTRNDYQERILRVLTHIQQHLSEPLDLEGLSGIACFSSFHFHRIFSAMTGETIADHVRRLRLEGAAIALRSGAKSVLEIALEAGYESHEAFSRAFKAAYGFAPAQFRRQPAPVTLLPAPSGVHYLSGAPVKTFKIQDILSTAMKIIIRKIKPLRVAYLRHVGPYEKVGPTFTDLAQKLAADGCRAERALFIGVPYDDPNLTPPAECRYDACVTVNKKYSPRAPVAVQTIAGGEYAVAKNCTREQIGEAYKQLFGRWLPRSGRELRTDPSFVIAAAGPSATMAPKKRRMDVYLPLQPRRRSAKVLPFKIEVRHIEPMRVAFRRHVGPYNQVHRIWTDLTLQLKEEGQIRKDSSFIGIPYDDPKVTPPGRLRYDACVTVGNQYAGTPPIGIQTIEGGDYVVAVNCPIGGIAKAYATVFGEWLPRSGRAHRNAPSFISSSKKAGDIPIGFAFTDIHVPLEPKK